MTIYDIRTMLRRRAAGTRGDQRGFALLATILILGLASMILLALTAYTLSTTSFANAQNVRNKQSRAGDGALQAVVNQISRDSQANLGSLSPTAPCTPHQNQATASTDPFVTTVEGVTVNVTCTPVSSGQPPISTVPTAADRVSVIGGSAEQSLSAFKRSTICQSGQSVVCPDWTTAFTNSGAAGSAATIDAAGTTLNHSGPDALWFTADQVQVSKGAAALRSPLTCVFGASLDCAVQPDAADGSSVTAPTPALGVSGSYIQGQQGVLGSAGVPCGILSPSLATPLPAAQAKAKDTAHTICGDTNGVGTVSYQSGGNIVPDAPTDASGQIIGTPTWIQLNQVTALAPLGKAASDLTKGEAFSDFQNADLSYNNRTCPGAFGEIDLLPGAYTRDLTAILSKWFSATNCVNGIKFWFKPGYYWFDMSDPTTGNTAISISGSKDMFVFGSLVKPSARFYDQNTFPLCDSTQPGVSITLSQRTTFSHTGGRVGICGIKGKPAIYQGTDANVGWTATPGWGNTGTSSSNSFVGNAWGDFFGSIFGSTPTSRPPTNPSAFPSTGNSNCSVQVPTFNSCQGQTLVSIGNTAMGGQGWAARGVNGTSPGHVLIDSAIVNVTASSNGAGGDSYPVQPGVTIGVFLAGNNSANAIPNCGVFYRHVPDNFGASNPTVSYDIMDATHPAPNIPPCSSVIHYADQLWGSRIDLGFLYQMDSGLSIGSGYNLTVTNVALSAGWNPVGLKLTCGAVSPATYTASSGNSANNTTNCYGKDTTSAGKLTKSADVDVVTGTGTAQLKVQCGPGTWAPYGWPSWLQWIPEDSCGSGGSGTFNYPITDITNPYYTGSQPLTQVGVMIKGSDYCKTSNPIAIIAPHYQGCGPFTNGSGSYNPSFPFFIAPWDESPVTKSNNPDNWYLWNRPADDGGASMNIAVLNKAGAVICQTSAAHLPAWDETRYVALPVNQGNGNCTGLKSAQDLANATVQVTLNVSRSDAYLGGCDNTAVIGNGCSEYGYNLDWVGLTTSSSSPTTSTATYQGPTQPDRITESLTGDYSAGDASFNVYGQVVLPRADLDIKWAGPVTGNLPAVIGTNTNGVSLVTPGQSTLVVGALNSATANPLPAGSTPGLIANRQPTVGVPCCEPYKASVRKVMLIARLATSNGSLGPIVGTATLDVVDLKCTPLPAGSPGASSCPASPIPGGSYLPGQQVIIEDWRICNVRTQNTQTCTI